MSDSIGASPWAATAPPGPVTWALEGVQRTDVAIVGAGYTGLSTALHLAGLGVQSTVLEGGTIGAGGSGRNGGQVIPGLKYEPDELEKLLGKEQGSQLNEIVGNTVEDVFHLIHTHQIQCEPVRNGWIQAAHDPVALKAMHRRGAQWAKRGVAVQLLDRAAISALIGTDLYHGGWLDPRAAGLNPLAYVRGMAQAALKAGAKVHTHSRVVRLERLGTGWRLHTADQGILDAEKVVLATNAYTDDLWPKLRQTMIAANSFQIATRPLPPQLRATVMPGGQSVSDTRRVLRYFRVDGAGRLIMGGRGPFREPRSAQDFAHLDRSVSQMFPQLKDESFEYRWSGRVGLTRDFIPHLHTPAPGVLACVGYNGRGVGMATTMGRLIAHHLVDPQNAPLPLPFTAITPIPLHRLHTVYVSLLIAWYRFLDELGIG